MAYEAYKTGITPLNMVQQPPFTIETPGAKALPGETVPRRHVKARDGLWERPAPEVDTCFALVQRSGERFSSEPAMGSRKFQGLHKEMKKVSKVIDGEVRKVDKEWTFFDLSSYSYITYSEYYRNVLQVGAGLRKLGLVRHDKLHVFAATSAEWLTMAHACSAQSLTVVTAYDTLGAAGVQHSLTQTEAVAMFTDPHLFKVAAGPLEAAKTVRTIIYNQNTHQPVPDAEIEAFRQSHPHLRVLSFEEVRKLGEDSEGEPALPPDPPKPEDLFCIMYTSGSTGLPKGVPVTHAAFVAAVAGLNSCVEEVVSPNERILAYLPLAHIFELVLENLVIFVGATLGFGSPRTLTDASMTKGSIGDILAFQPTILVGVPQVWETVRKGVSSGVDKAGLVAKALFWGHYTLKGMLADAGLLVGPVAKAVDIVDNIVFGKVRQGTGNRIRFTVNGASVIASDTRRFLSLVVAPMINGYGLTETCGNGSLGSPLQWTSTSIGPISAALEMKLVGQPDLGYDANPPADSDEDPHGEILVRGKPVLTAYYKSPEETAGAITADGWFRTGDIGAFDRTTGHVRIVDRLKNLVKMQGGEYVALEKLESVYRGVAAVQNMMVYADAEHARPVAVVCVNPKAVAATAEKLGIEVGEDAQHHSTAHHEPKVRTQVLRDMLAVGKSAGLTSIELLQGVALVDDEWTPDSGLVTATQKLNRRALRERYKKELAEAWA